MLFTGVIFDKVYELIVPRSAVMTNPKSTILKQKIYASKCYRPSNPAFVQSTIVFYLTYTLPSSMDNSNFIVTTKNTEHIQCPIHSYTEHRTLTKEKRVIE